MNFSRYRNRSKIRRVELLTKNHTANTSNIPSVDFLNCHVNGCSPKTRAESLVSSSRKPKAMTARKPTL